MADSEARQPNAFLVFLGVAASISVVILIVGGVLARRPRIEDVDAARAAQRIEAREKLDQADRDALTTASWVDKEKGLVRLPVADAIKLVAQDLATKKPAPSQVKVDAPLPMPPPFDPNSKEPPVSALPSAPQGADTIRFDPPAPPAAAAPVQSPAPAPAAAVVAPASERATASVAPARPPLIHFTEARETKQ
jgi:DNA polymerase III subunit gamma/tau